MASSVLVALCDANCVIASGSMIERILIKFETSRRVKSTRYFASTKLSTFYVLVYMILRYVYVIYVEYKCVRPLTSR